jgi:hypothetical protein
MFVEPDVNGSQLMDMMGFHVNQFSIWCQIRPQKRVLEHAFYKLSTTYRSQYQYTLKADTSYVENIFGKSVSASVSEQS